MKGRGEWGLGIYLPVNHAWLLCHCAPAFCMCSHTDGNVRKMRCVCVEMPALSVRAWARVHASAAPGSSPSQPRGSV